MDNVYQISTSTIVKFILLILVAAFLYYVRDIVVLFLVAVFLTALLEPGVDWLQRKGVKRPLAVLFIFLSVFVVLGGLISILMPQIITEFKALMTALPDLINQVSGFLSNFGKFPGFPTDQNSLIEKIGNGITGSGSAIFSTTISFISGIVSFIVVLVLSFYMSVKEDAIKSFLMTVTPDKAHGHVGVIVEKIKTKLGKWMQGQLLLMLIVSILYLIAFLIIGVPYALVLALIGGILEIIPYAGPIIAGVMAASFGFLESPLQGFLVLAVFFVVNQLENHVIIPQVMKKTVGLNPVAIIMAILIGAKVAGIVGIILAVPVATAISVVLGDLYHRQKVNS